MTCNHCRANVEKVIRTVKGVESVSVDLQSGVATVTGDDIDDKIDNYFSCKGWNYLGDEKTEIWEKSVKVAA